MDFYGHRIGETPFYQDDALTDRIAGISRKGVPKVYIKDEADNPSGSHKARVVARAIERYASGSGHEVILTRITEGGFTETFGYLAKFAPNNVSFASVVDHRTPRSEVRKMFRYGHVVKADLDAGKLNSSQIAELVRKKTGRRDAIVIPIDNIDPDGTGCESISRELYDSGVGGEYSVFMPVGGANTMVDVIHGFEKKGEVPKMRGATIPGNLFSDVPENGHGAGTHLHAAFSSVEREMRRLITKYKIPIYTIDSDEEIGNAMKFLQGAGIRAGCTSSVPWAAIERYAREIGFEDGENVVYLNTGYEIPPAVSRTPQWRRYAACLLTVAVLLPIAGDNNLMMSEKIRNMQERQETERIDILREYDLYDIKAFADYIGGSEAEKERIVSKLRIHMNIMHSEPKFSYEIEKNDPGLKRLREDFYSFDRIRRASRATRSDDNVLQARYDLRRLLRAKYDLPETEHEFNLDGVGGSFIKHYLEMDPSLNNKIAFAIARTGGIINSEFVQIVSDLHYPDVGNIERLICFDDPKCVQLFRDYDKWKEDQKKNRDESIKRQVEFEKTLSNR